LTNSCRGIVVFIVGINYCAVSTQVFGFIVYLRLGGSILLIIIPLNPLISFTKAKEHKKFFLSRDSLISSQGLEYKKKGEGKRSCRSTRVFCFFPSNILPVSLSFAIYLYLIIPT